LFSFFKSSIKFKNILSFTLEWRILAFILNKFFTKKKIFRNLEIIEDSQAIPAMLLYK